MPYIQNPFIFILSPCFNKVPHTPRNYIKIGARVDNKYIQTSPFFCYCIHLATEIRSPNWWQFLFLKCLYFTLCRIYFWGQFGMLVLLDPVWNIDNFQHCTKTLTFWAVFKLLQYPPPEKLLANRAVFLNVMETLSRDSGPVQPCQTHAFFLSDHMTLELNCNLNCWNWINNHTFLVRSACQFKQSIMNKWQQKPKIRSIWYSSCSDE